VVRLLGVWARQGNVPAIKLMLERPWEKVTDDDSDSRRGPRPLARIDELARVAPLDVFAEFCARNLTLDNGDAAGGGGVSAEVSAALFDGARETLVLLPKKNGKSTTLGALAIFHLADDAGRGLHHRRGVA
jgi:hypothetical protein